MKIIQGLWDLKKKTLFDVYLCTAYRCSNMELGPIMGGKYKREKVSLLPPPIWLPVRLSFSDIHFQKWKFNRRLWCKSQAIALCGVEGRIKPSNHSRRCLGASNIMPYPLDRSHILQCAIAANNSPCLRFVGPKRRRKFRELPTWLFFFHTGVLRAVVGTFQ